MNADADARIQNLLQSQLQRTGPRAKKDELAEQLEGVEKELGKWKMRLRLYPKVPSR